MKNTYKVNEEAVKKIAERVYDNGTTVINRNDLEEMFPALKESEDERTWIINYLSNSILNSTIIAEKENLKRAIDWLEKHGEQKESYDTCDSSMMDNKKSPYGEKRDFGYFEQNPAKNIEPKFKVGDWVVNKFGDVWHIDSFDKKNYQVSNGDKYNYFPISKQNEMHLWTIQDAKDGDILFQDLMGGKTFIYNGVNPDMAILYSFIINNDGEDVLPYHIGKPNTGIGNIEENKNIIHPATNEQRDLLFQKMKEAGYEWDDKKKELRKIEQKPADAEKGAKGNEREIPNSSWSEEDEGMLQTVINRLELSRNDYASEIPYVKRCVNWLKSLKERYTWKPSGEQMDAIKDAIDYLGGNTKIVRKHLMSLYEQLKKLKG